MISSAKRKKRQKFSIRRNNSSPVEVRQGILQQNYLKESSESSRYQLKYFLRVNENFDKTGSIVKNFSEIAKTKGSIDPEKFRANNG